MLPIRLEMKNFLAYRSPEPLHFEGIHLACLSGANGAGKSSLLDAITWALWGKARTRRDEDLIHQGQTDMHVLLEFEQGGIHYQVMRARSRSRSAGTLAFFSLDDDGVRTELSDISVRATQALIEKTIKLDYDTFVHSAFLQQGRADAFTMKTPNARKQLLADILGLSRWETYEARAKTHLTGIDAEITGAEGQIREIELAVQREPDVKRRLLEMQQQLIEASERARVANDAYDLLRDVEPRRRAAEDHQRDAKERLRAAEIKLSQVTQRAQIRRGRVEEFEKLLLERDQIETGFTALQTARERDQAFGEKLSALKTLDDQRAELKASISAAKAQIESDLKACGTTISALKVTSGNADPDKLDALRGQIATLKLRDGERLTRQAEVDAHKEERARLVAEYTALRADMKKLDERRKRLQSVADAFCPFCGQPLDADQRAAMIADIETEGTPMGEQARQNSAHTKALETLIAEGQAVITDIAIALQPLADLQGQVGKLEERLKAAAEAAAQLDGHYARRDQLQRALDEDAYAHAEREALALLNTERDRLGYDDAVHAGARKDLRAYHEYEVRYRQLQQAVEALDQARVDLLEVETEQAQQQDTHAAELAITARLDAEIVELKALANEAKRRFDELQVLRKAESVAHQEVGAVKQELDAIAHGRIRRVDLNERISGYRQQRALYEELREAFGKKGIPAMIIDAALPELEEAANRLLGRMTDGQMSIAISTQREKITGGVAETLDIHIADGLGTRQYEMYSGGEAFRINFALRVALSQMLARRAGAQLRTLFIDEGFGTQDENGRSKLVEAITAIQDDFDLILAITHIDELRDAFPVHILVEKTADGSQLALR